MARRPRREISPERRGSYAVGLVLQVIGGIVIVVCFLGFVLDGNRAVGSMGREGNPVGFFIGFFLGMVLVAVGGGVRHVAARGVAGSGLTLDPDRARDDLEPWARTGGGLLKDALDEAGIGGERDRPEDDPIVKVRCRECGTLNDDDARFCDACGAKL